MFAHAPLGDYSRSVPIVSKSGFSHALVFSLSLSHTHSVALDLFSFSFPLTLYKYGIARPPIQFKFMNKSEYSLKHRLLGHSTAATWKMSSGKNYCFQRR